MHPTRDTTTVMFHNGHSGRVMPGVMWPLKMCARTIFLLIALISITLAVVAQEKTASESQIPTVRFCDLVRYPNRYDKKIVRTTAIYEAYYHGTFLYDPNCKSADANINAELERSSAFGTASIIEKELEKAMSRHQKYGAGRARVVVIGRFNDWDGVGYGHLAGSRFQFDVMAFESAKPVASSIPWNAKSDGAESFMEDVTGIKNGIDVEWNFAYLLNNETKLENILPVDYVLTNEQGVVLNKSQVISLAIEGGRISTGGAMVDEHKIFISGNTAAATGRATSGNCKNVTRQYRFTNRYVKRNGNWEIISSQLRAIVPVEVPDNLPCN